MESQLREYLQHHICTCDIMNGYYCGHAASVDTAIGMAKQLTEVPLSQEAQDTIDELREQNKIMRKIMQMVVAEHEESFNELEWSCAWCGAGLEDSIEDTAHEEKCLILSTKLLLTTIPEIK